MSKFNLLKFSIAAAFLTCSASPQVYAQPNMLNFDGNYYNEYIGERLMVVSPSSIARSLDYTISNDGSGTGQWGGAITAVINGDIAVANPYKGCSAITGVTGKIALIERGDCEFGAKAKNAQDAGAIAVMIVNNIDGGPVGMGAGAVGGSVTIPVFMISKDDGAAIANAASSGNVSITISKWGSGRNHDLAILKSGLSMWHNYAIPANQMGNASSHDPYKGLDAVVVANVGISTENNIRLASKVEFTPNGGSTELIKMDTSAAISSFTVGDSIKVLLNPSEYNLKNSTQEGRYDITYEVLLDGTDDFPADNKAKYSFYTTRKVYSKARYDFANDRPISLGGYRYGSSQVTNYTWGPLFYVAKGGYKIESVQAIVSADNNDNLETLGSPLNVFIWKWEDGTGGQPKDNIMQRGEIAMIGEASHEFVSTDTSGQPFTINATSIDASKQLVTSDRSWYWVTAAMPNTAFLQVDGNLNYYVRTFGRFYANSADTEYFSPSLPNDASELDQADPATAVGMFPFEATDLIDSARFSEQRKGLVPAIAMITSQFPVSVQNIENGKFNTLAVFPNPAKEVVTVSGNLNTPTEKVYLRVLDGIGRVVVDEVRNYSDRGNYSISINRLPSGNYYMVLTTGKETKVAKFVIAK